MFMFWLFVAVIRDNTVAAGAEGIVIEGVGGGLPYHLYREFIYSYEEAHPDVSIVHHLTDSWNGICSITRQCLPPGTTPYLFSASSLPLPHDIRIQFPELVEFPTMAGAIAITYNLPGIDLRLTLDLIIGIYLGRIRNWNHPLILATNPHAAMPDAPIDVVARSDISSNTKILTQIFANENTEWTERYGVFHDSNWSTIANYGLNWPPGVVKYFAVESIGMVGIVKSFANTIGYAALADASEYHLQIAQLYNARGVLIGQDDFARGIESAMDYFVLNEYEGLSPELSHANSPDAYPLGILSFMIINMTTSPEINCRQMIEFLHFIELTIMNAHNRAEARKFSMIPLTQKMAERVRNDVLKKVTCRGDNVYNMLLKQIAQGKILSSTTLIGSFATISGVFIVVVIGAFVFLSRRAKNRLLDAEKLIWQPSDFTFVGIYSRINTAGSSSGDKGQTESSSNTQSVISDKSVSETKPSTAASSLRNAPPLGIMSQEAVGEDIAGERSQLHGCTDSLYVFLFKMPGGINSQSITRESKQRLLNLKTVSESENVMRLLGLAMLDKSGNSFSLFSGASNWKWLNTVLKKSKYKINDDVRLVLAKDVASGMQYLHSQRISHGALSSVSCFIDPRWAIKISDWIGKTIFEDTYGSRAWSAYIRATFEKYVALGLEDINHEDDVAMQYLDPTLITQSDSRLQNENFSHESDVYSYGLLLFELWTQREPFSEANQNHNGQIYSGNINDDSTISEHSVKKLVRPKRTMTSILVERINPVVPSILPSGVKKIAKSCVDAITEHRPPFAKIKTLLDKLGGSKGSNIVETLMQSMEEYMQGLQEKVDERTAHLQETTDKMDILLSSMLPREIITKLQNGSAVDPEYFDSATVYFSDIVGFTNISATSSPLEIVAMLNSLYSLFDETIERFDVYKVETIGDSYMCVSGVPRRNGMIHINEIVEMSLLIISNIKIYKIPHIPNTALQIRVGINSGPLMAGVVGLKMPRYCLFGDTVNTASRMESTSAPMRIQATAATVHDLERHFPGKFKVIQRGKVEIKGKGFMETYWIQTFSQHSDLPSVADSASGGPSRFDPETSHIPMYKALV